jgi:hypothetical protein
MFDKNNYRKGLYNMKKIYRLLFTIVIMLFLVADLAAQGKIYDGPEDGAGDPYLEREGFMTGNRVQLLIKNNTELGDYPRKDAARWPKGLGGNVMHDGLGILISAPVFLTNGNTPVTDPVQIEALAAQNLIDTLFFCQTNYREEMDRDPTGQIEWGLHPAPGYINNLSETPAMSNDPNSWPPEGWLYTDRMRHWAGEWDGRFGRGQIRSDLEAYFVANDAQDLEYLGDDDRIKYFPRDGVKIGDIDPSVTVQKGQPWGGLGIRVKQRVFQWNNPMAQDCIFSEYTIANISKYDLPYVAFGYWLDNDIGGENSGEDGSFDQLEDLSYSWDTDGLGEDGYRTGTAGYAYLESPGIFNDNDDNDDDGLVDENRGNEAGSARQPFAPVDLQKYLTFYGLKMEDLPADHWPGDEDADWVDGDDLNGDGIYQPDEFAGDDVGLDGVGPGEENYLGPDIDGSECNHKPDIGDGYGAEPDFGWTDVSETDMLGLTTLIFQEAVAHVDPYTGWFRHDQSIWEQMSMVDSLMSGASDISNLFELFSTAIFPLYKGSTEFISISELHSYDDLAGLNAIPHVAPALFTLKKTVQVIYEKDYRFAQPPKMPTLSAIPGDGYVQLIWDNRADRLTREPFLGNINDFEGYKVYRSTDKDMKDPMLITDGYGTRTLLKPIFHCDLRNGRRGFTDYGLLNGMAYNLGEDTGIAYSYRDVTVQNGRTYYYAVVAYDYGIRAEELKGTSVVAQDPNYGIAPSENNVVIRQNEYEQIEFIGPNVAVVTPGTEGAGNVIETDIDIDDSGSNGAGTILPEVIDYNLVDPDRTYTVKFIITRLDSASRFSVPYAYSYTTSGLQVYDGDRLVFEDVLMETDEEVIVQKNYVTVLEPFNNNTADSDDDYYHLAYTEEKATEIFEGLRLRVKMDIRTSQYDYANSGWMPGNAPINIVFNENEIHNFSWDYNIVFSDEVLYTGKLPTAAIRDENNTRIDADELLFNQNFNFKIETVNFSDSLGKPYQLEMIVHDLNGNQTFDMLEDRIIVGTISSRDRWDGTAFIIDFLEAQNESALPQPNDVYAMRFRKPFNSTDSITFRINAQKRYNPQKAKYTMDKIKVVPNPYVASNMMEPSVVNKYLNQSRRLLFTNLPEKCTIKIFTISGILVRELHAPENALTNYGGFGSSSSGVLHWDMLNKEGLEIAAGMYFYHVKDDISGEEKTGKFGVLK